MRQRNDMHQWTAAERAIHDACWVLKAPCWHDGTSLYAEERYLPYWQISPHDHDGMFRRLEIEYVRRFLEDEDDQA